MTTEVKDMTTEVKVVEAFLVLLDISSINASQDCVKAKVAEARNKATQFHGRVLEVNEFDNAFSIQILFTDMLAMRAFKAVYGK